MNFESLIYIVVGIAFIIYRHYKQTQKAKQAGTVNRDAALAEEQSYEQEPEESNVLSVENLFEEFGLEKKKYQRKLEKEEPVLKSTSVSKQAVMAEEGVRTTLSVEEKFDIAPEPVIEERPKESVSDILRKYKESKQNESPATPVFQDVEINIQKKVFQFDARQAFIYSEIFRRKYE